MNQFQIRNFAIIAHVDAGKSTLSDRLMQKTGTVTAREAKEQLLDSNPIERERGVTIKLAPVTMNYELRTTNYVLNLIDTPGHVDFSYEVERSLAACEGAILLIDATKGIQAQTLAHATKALSLGLTLIPAINKIDLDSANAKWCEEELQEVFGYKENEITKISAKEGNGVDELLVRIIDEIPTPGGSSSLPTRALVFNSVYDDYLGVIAFVKVVDGSIEANQEVVLMQTGSKILPKEIGIFTPTRKSREKLETGQVGYIATGLKDIHEIHIGDTLTTRDALKESARPALLPGYREPKPVVFVDAFPEEETTYQELVEAIEKLKLSDASLWTQPVHSSVLGAGLRLGFLGLFHIEITRERLLREHGVDTLFTTPTVEYVVEKTNGEKLIVQNPTKLPDPTEIKEIREPIVQATLLVPAEYVGQLMEVLEKHRGIYQTTEYFSGQAKLIYKLPLAELISGLIDQIKSNSRGFATIDYESLDPEPVKAVKLTILVHHEPVEALARIVVEEQAESIGRRLVDKMKDILPPQQFAVAIQAAIGGKIIARETKKALRKDVTAKLYGGDQTRKDKLLKKQKKGKKLMAQSGKVYIPADALAKMATS